MGIDLLVNGIVGASGEFSGAEKLPFIRKVF